LINDNPDTCFYLKKNSEIVGTIFGAFNGRRAWIYHLCIHPKYQKQGLGTLLVRKVEDELKKKGATKILLSVSVVNLKIIPFYLKLGYKMMNDLVTFENDLWREKQISVRG